jgi:23S rRNA C2498 (ribose-2'-O)-methylase RlmM
MADAPNLAWKKLEETLLWSGAPIRAGQQVLQIGCAPGGASLALLRQGLNITGVDPAQMDQRVLNNRRFTWIQSEINEVAEGLPERLDWLVVDAAMTPQRLIRSVRRFGPRYKRSLQGAILHFKLTDWRFADQLPGFMADVADLGFSRVRAAQLASHRGEVVVYARR